MAVNPTRKPRAKPAPARPRRGRPAAGEPDNRAELTKQAILDAALEVFTEQTYGGARIEQIAERAGVAMGTIYKYFPSKRALVNEVFRSSKRKTLEYSFPHTAGMKARERIHGWVVQFCRFANDYPLAHEFLLTHHHAPYLDKESLALGDPMDRLAARMIRDGQADGSFRKGDPELLVAMVLGMFLGLTRELRARGEQIDDKVLALCEECEWNLLRAR